ncbi:nucleoside hydrolase [Paenibacillus filicis]|uniref:Nucleoside hydrolase n=1 Tax=Paenibacillus filicis TaxID=669464 RepID=A0ABU9DFV6_9BACL
MSLSDTSIPLLLDVDTGTDDSLALLYALRSPEARIVGITTAVGNVSAEQATVNTLKVLELEGSGRQIPVVKGADRPLRREWPGTKTAYHGENGLAGYELPEPGLDRSGEDAAAFIVRQADALAGELTLVFVGRLTNLAEAIRLDPTLPGKIKRLVIMGGALRVPGNVTPYAESNIHGDPEAAAIVFASGIPLTMVGLDVTASTLFREAHLQQLRSRSPEGNEAVLAFAEHLLTFRMQAYLGRKGILACPIHDPLAVAIALDPALAETEQVRVSIDTTDTYTLGATREVRGTGEGHPVLVCTKVQDEAFLQRFVGRLTLYA